ncbi:HD-GYP domain-containing protein, partial [Piscinibacter sp.]|uniref:HD-GYP domain-containing protein n=1 Tax=Piscinibacter sp. TaxID=1903157 RepID=UPI002F42FC18
MAPDRTEPVNSVNPHYLDHVVAVGESHGVEASVDIVAGNGTKLLSRGARIDAVVRERLLQHKLRQPLEDCVRVIGGVIPERFGPIAERLLERHPVLRALCAVAHVQPVPASLVKLRLSVPMQSLLTVYCEHKEDQLEHTVGVSMLALALARRLLPGEIERHRTLAMAGLVHDVGELYIDPQCLRPGARVGPREWKHIVTHPVVGHRVLRDMVGAGAGIAEAVLNHHERLDGFGYPRGIGGDALALDGQILAAAEWLMALVDSGRAPLLRASVATRLILGEFNPAVLHELAVAAQLAQEAQESPPSPAALEDAVPRVLRIAGTLRRFHELQGWILERIEEASPALKPTLDIGMDRMLRIQKAFSMTGLDAHNPQLLLRELAALQDPAVHVEVLAVLRELEWRLRELEREQLWRAGLLPDPECAVVCTLIDRLKGVGPGTV